MDDICIGDEFEWVNEEWPAHGTVKTVTAPHVDESGFQNGWRMELWRDQDGNVTRNPCSWETQSVLLDPRNYRRHRAPTWPSPLCQALMRMPGPYFIVGAGFRWRTRQGAWLRLEQITDTHIEYILRLAVRRGKTGPRWTAGVRLLQEELGRRRCDGRLPAEEGYIKAAPSLNFRKEVGQLLQELKAALPLIGDRQHPLWFEVNRFVNRNDL